MICNNFRYISSFSLISSRKRLHECMANKYCMYRTDKKYPHSNPKVCLLKIAKTMKSIIFVSLRLIQIVTPYNNADSIKILR